MENEEEVVSNFRSSILKHLQLLADEEAQRVYERGVPIADVPAELVCGWFDDSYHPDDPVFQAAFNQRELAVLATFDELFDAALAELPERLPALPDLQARPEWRRVIAGAAAALRGLSTGVA